MIQLALRFVSGRYHATPWLHHVNEGVPEWPPSPWRLLRAAVSLLHNRSTGIPFELAYGALLKLTPPPAFTLPPATAGHTRHYLSLNEVDRSGTALVLDTFIVVERDAPLVFHWPVALSSAEHDALGALFARLPYFGRAESWCMAELLREGAPAPDPNCHPGDGTARRDQETVRVLCPSESVAREDLERTTAGIQREGWLDPPGSRWVFYGRPVDALRGAPRLAPMPPRRASCPTMAEIVLGGPVLPLFTDAVPFAAKVRRALLALHGTPSVNLAGKEANGNPLAQQHRHAHFVPDARDPRRPNRVTHLLVYCPAGLTRREQDAVLRLRTITPDEEGGPEVAVLCNGFGEPEDFATAVPQLRPARCWRSRTPVVLPRHPKRNGRHSVEEQIRSELSARGLPEPVAVRPLGPGSRLNDRYRTAEFDLRRAPWDPWPTTPALGLEIELADAVRGPILLGRNSHYGLGQFQPTDPV